MMGILGHDLRSPIGTITLAGDLLLHRDDVPPPAREHVLRIRRSADRMKEMIDTLLDFTRLRFLGQVPISPVPADLADISRTTVDEMRVVWPDRPIDLEVPRRLPWRMGSGAHVTDDLQPGGQRDRARRSRGAGAASASTATDLTSS